MRCMDRTARIRRGWKSPTSSRPSTFSHAERKVRANLLDFDAAGLAAYVESIGEKGFRARQLMRWIHQRGEHDFGAMTDLAKSLRARLAAGAEVTVPGVVRDTLAADGTRKWLLDIGGGNAIETV